MAIHPSTALLKAELVTPSVPAGSLDTIAAIIKTQRPALLPLLDQVAVIEALLSDVIEDETNEQIPTESPRQTMVAIRRWVQRIDDEQYKLLVALRKWEDDKANIIARITREE